MARNTILLSRQNSDPSSSIDPGGGGGAGGSGTQQLLSLIADPFSSEIQSTSFFASLAWTFGLSILLALAFCFLRPRSNAVYAPRAKHADDKHAPPRLGKGLFSWFAAIKDVKEQDLVEKIGLDAVVFLRFTRMLRNIFLILTCIGCGVLLPINLTPNNNIASGRPSKRQVGGSQNKDFSKVSTFMKMTPQYIFGEKFWAFTICAYIFTGVILGFLWWNYRVILRLRRAYFESHDYQHSLHSRTLMLTHIPSDSRTDEGIIRLAQRAKATEDVPKTAVGRNVKDLPELIEEHQDTVKRLEKHLARYLKNPDSLPAKRPTCKPSKKDRARDGALQVDAIDYLTGRIRELEIDIKQVRESVDKRNPMPFGFASYTHIEDAHAVAYACRSKGPEGTVIRLSPKPNDIIWKNLPMSRQARNSKSFWNGIWMTVLTIVFIVPNIVTSIFLSDFANLGLVWKAFGASVSGHPTLWGIIQGIIAPAVQALFYLFLPKIFRKLFHNSGDTTKTSRERHVTNRLYTFFIFNQLIVFSIFAALWRFTAAVVAASHTQENTWEAIKENRVFSHIVIGLCNTTPFWMTAQIQKNLGAAVDLIQILPLLWGTFKRRYLNPTPREVIELSAPQPFEYADYYNAYLFTATVGFVFSMYQPLILPITAAFIAAEAWLKKYLLQYVLITKTESGGAFWRILVNRILFSTLLMDGAVAILVGSQGVGLSEDVEKSRNAAMLYAMIPLPFLILGFKFYCQQVFDNKIGYYTTRTVSDIEADKSMEGKFRRRNDRVGVRFGNPALYKKLMTPMVAAKSQHLLKELYSGRLDQDMEGTRNGQGVFGYSDMYMSQMSHDQPGKSARGDNPFEIVTESEMDFGNFKKRAEFREEFGGDGELYGRADDQSRHGSRPGSVASMSTMGMTGAMGGYGRPESPSSDSRGSSRTRVDDGAGDDGTMYPKGYHTTPAGRFRGDSPLRYDANSRAGSVDITMRGHPAFRDNEAGSRRGSGRGTLLHHAASMGQMDHSAYDSRPATPDEETSYDAFRRGRR